MRSIIKSGIGFYAVSLDYEVPAVLDTAARSGNSFYQAVAEQGPGTVRIE